MSAAAVSMIIWISGVTDIGSTPPPSAATVGLMSSTKPKTQIAATPARKMATLRFAKGFSTISAAGAGGVTSPAVTLRWYSTSSSRSLPWRLMTSDIAKMPTMLAGIVISRTSTRS